MISGPGMLAVIFASLFIHLFTEANAKPVLIAGLVIFFVIFTPLYVFEYFKQQTEKEKRQKGISFKRRNTRLEWEGGNIHGKVPTEKERPGKLFKN